MQREIKPEDCKTCRHDLSNNGLGRYNYDPCNFCCDFSEWESVMDIYEEIKNERKRQDKKWGGPNHDDLHNTANWCEWIGAYAIWAKTMASFDSHDKYRKRMIQVAALAVAALESHDRMMIKREVKDGKRKG